MKQQGRNIPRSTSDDLEQETLHGSYGPLYALGLVLVLLAQLPNDQRKVLLRRAWVLIGESVQLEKIK